MSKSWWYLYEKFSELLLEEIEELMDAVQIIEFEGLFGLEEKIQELNYRVSELIKNNLSCNVVEVE